MSVPAPAGKPRWSQWLTSGLMIAGIVSCLVALYTGLGEVRGGFAIGASGYAWIAVLAVLILLASAAGWSLYLRAISGTRLGLRTSLKQVALLLIGKYVPGMVAGLAARVTSNSGRVAAVDVLRASLIEQLGALMAATLASLVCIVLVFSLPLSLLVGLLAGCTLLPAPALLLWLSAFVRRRNVAATTVDHRAVRLALLAQMGQWALTMVLASSVFGMLDPQLSQGTVVELAGWYGLAVVVGILVVVVPGGLGIRELCFIWPALQHLDEASALTLALVMRLVMTAVDLIAVVLWVVSNVGKKAR